MLAMSQFLCSLNGQLGLLRPGESRDGEESNDKLPHNANIPGGNLGLLALLAVTYFSVKYARDSYRLSKTKKKILDRQAKAEAGKIKLQKRLEKCPNIDLSITKLSFADLQEKLQRGDLTATDVLLAYQAKALQVTREINCVTDFIENAEARASTLDKLDPSERGPLHGIPLSVKEAVGVKGYDCTGGISCFIDDLKTEDGVLLQVLINQGAVPFARTNLSQGQMSASCSNPIFGETFNPVDHSRSCGGSTGGEGALIGAGASPMGLGCDMAGSIRIPCHFCGICGMKPTPNRLSGAGNYTFGQGIVTLAEVYGPMGKDVKSVVELFKASLTPQLFELDPLLPGTTWKEEIFNSTKPMKIGFYVHDGAVEAAPAIKRCVLQAKRVLEARGHTLVEFAPPEILYVTEHLFYAAILGDDCEQMSTYMKDDVVDPCIQDLFHVLSLPHWIRSLLSRISYFLTGINSVSCYWVSWLKTYENQL
ncbi:fatty-acid amide hydrolase 1 [Plakobranchus ocellatus]|uniref:Fatty-acid amide hydrolase 1 n=1 Tax=Plakobranchus ocellatus TaxID=259542 RepID=A0AAV4AWS3_9GAST|nr:fatty-acid amide hydrolase 1 [Plakobranchus ocellatus]